MINNELVPINCNNLSSLFIKYKPYIMSQENKMPNIKNNSGLVPSLNLLKSINDFPKKTDNPPPSKSTIKGVSFLNINAFEKTSTKFQKTNRQPFLLTELVKYNKVHIQY